MKNMLKNKKGFTLVELLAVVVILALLIVITANTVLPMLDKTKVSGIKTYASRVLTNTETHWSADNLITTQTVPKYYLIKGNITKKSDYVGCVKITGSASEGYKYQIRMYDLKNALFLTAGTDAAPLEASAFSNQSSFTVETYKATGTGKTNYVIADADTLESTYCSASGFASLTKSLGK